MFRPLLLFMIVYNVMDSGSADDNSTTTTVTTTENPGTTTTAQQVCASNSNKVSTDLLSWPNGLSDDAITATSDQVGYEAYYGRLNNESAWCSNYSKQIGSYMQFEFPSIMCFTEVITQGYLWGGSKVEYVKKFTIMTSTDCSNYTPYQNFTGNVDDFSYKNNTFSEPVAAKCIRLVVLDFQKWITMRVGLLGYDANN